MSGIFQQARTVVTLPVDARIRAGFKVSKGRVTSPLMVLGDDPFTPPAPSPERTSGYADRRPKADGPQSTSCDVRNG